MTCVRMVGGGGIPSLRVKFPSLKLYTRGTSQRELQYGAVPPYVSCSPLPLHADTTPTCHNPVIILCSNLPLCTWQPFPLTTTSFIFNLCGNLPKSDPADRDAKTNNDIHRISRLLRLSCSRHHLKSPRRGSQNANIKLYVTVFLQPPFYPHVDISPCFQ